jgi:hypothetical protein
MFSIQQGYHYPYSRFFRKPSSTFSTCFKNVTASKYQSIFLYNAFEHHGTDGSTRANRATGIALELLEGASAEVVAKSSYSGPFDEALSGSKSSTIEFMQKRFPVGAGPSSKTWPRWALQRPQTTSVRSIPNEESFR